MLLRRAQHPALSDAPRRAAIARHLLAGKLRNGRAVLLRGARDAREPEEAAVLRAAAEAIGAIVGRLPERGDVEALRGDEGEAAATYYDAFGLLVKEDREALGFSVRSRRPPRDPMNALLSFLYTLLRIDCVAALEAAGLDPQVGFLHALRPGRPALALDLMEELRPVVADRLALALVNRRQLTRADFEAQPGGATLLTEQGRRTTLVAWQKRKQEPVEHRVAGAEVPLGLLPHLQARLLARHLRGDLEAYLPWLAR